MLDKGLKHNLDKSYNNKENLKQTIADCERALNLVDSSERNHARHLVLEKLNKVKAQPIKINRVEANTIKSLRKKLADNDVLVLKADKGNTTVLMPKKDYVDKTEEFLRENNIKEISKDPTSKYQNNIKAAIKNINLIMDKSEKLKVV